MAGDPFQGTDALGNESVSLAAHQSVELNTGGGVQICGCQHNATLRESSPWSSRAGESAMLIADLQQRERNHSVIDGSLRTVKLNRVLGAGAMIALCIAVFVNS